jgi:DNA polymerase III delta prime subunit
LPTGSPSNEPAAPSKEKNEELRAGRRKARKPSPDNPPKETKTKKTVSNKTAVVPIAELLEVDPNLVRRKRQKSGSPEDENHDNEDRYTIEELVPSEHDGYKALSGTNSVFANTVDDCHADGSRSRRNTNPSNFKTTPSASTPCEILGQRVGQIPSALIGDSTNTTSTSAVAAHGPADDSVELSSHPSSINFQKANTTKVQKTLRLNAKTGTIGSPPAKKPARACNSTEPKKKSAKAIDKAKSVIVTVRYGHDKESRSTIGRNIDDVLSGFKSFPFPLKPQHNLSKSVPQARTSKSTHPFFLGKIAPKALSSEHAEQIAAEVVKGEKATRPKSSMTLGEAKCHSPTNRQIPAARIGAFQNFGNTSKTMKFPGAVEACWPPKGMVHIRGSDLATSSSQLAQNATLSHQRKSKYTTTEALAKDDVLVVLATKLDIDDILRNLKCINTDDFAEPEKTLRVPLKHFENGIRIQRRVRRELSVKFPLNTTSESASDSEDELHGNVRKISRVHPALLKIYKSLPSSLTAFDRSQYETQSWIHKYAPCTAAEVLQCGKEAFILKEWLQSLTIIAVDPGTSDGARGRAMSAVSRRPGASNAEKSGKKKRKANKLDGFVISSEEEDNEMDEISDPDDSEGSYRLTKRTVIRSGNISNMNSRASKKLKNAIVISGPSGCGKTAMVYGVAKELGFEVFEINSSSRRSGKEILERVGDMARNHLVHRSDHLGLSNPQEGNNQRTSDAPSTDMKSGRQGTMSTFFKPKGGANPTTKNTTSEAAKKDGNDEATRSSKSPPKQQTQSLILLEEVDILFEEDKQFWATVMTLIAQSKRPIIMTCNDETLLPLQALDLHAIIRLSQPPVEVAVDYMLLVAAAEGHIINRRAVKALYEARQLDLRAALTELDYWCQLGIGDRKGGLDWFYPRWPPGCDVDEDGHQIRVVSEGTYKIGMGWLGRDYIFERNDEPDVKEEILRQAWDGWNVDIADWHESLEVESLLEDTTGDFGLPALLSYEAIVESMSVADICASGSLAMGNQVSEHDIIKNFNIITVRRPFSTPELP